MAAAAESTRSRARRRLHSARSTLLLQHPFFATLALRLTLQEDVTCHSAWTDGSRLTYNPDYINTLNHEKLVGLTAHLVMHPACGHHLRRNGRQFERWNEACDQAINWLLENAGFTLPDALRQRDEFRGMNAEAIYALLSDEVDEKKDEEENEGDGQTAAKNDDREQKEQQQQEDAAGSTSEAGLPGEVRDAPQLDGEAVQKGEEEWEEALLSAASQAREMGELPQGVARMIDNLLYPKLPWRELLARFIERNARSDYTWMTPNRRYLHRGLYFPALLNSELQEIAVAIDTSGSIEPRELEQFAAELSAIMEQLPSRLHLFYCDADIQGYRQIERGDLPLTLAPAGGGGTDFRPVFARIEKEQLHPVCLIYLTDLESLHFPDPPPFPVLWVQCGGSCTEPPFGEHISLGQAV